MSSRCRQRFAALVPLLALLVTLFPFQPPHAQAALPRPLTQQPVVRSTLNQGSEDAQLVRATLQHPIQKDVFYFVLPDRFQNGDTANDRGGSASTDPLQNGFKPDDKGYYHGGDLKGVLDKLDYIQNLGVTAIWMTPIFKNRAVQCGAEVTIAGCSAGYHGYWITDFTQLDPHLGTNEELTQLVNAAHGRGIKIFFDIITNHTADVIDYKEGPANNYAYRNKTNYPYKDANGQPFDDKQYAGTDTFPPLDVNTSFPYTPTFRTPADATAKAPAWLNDPRYYHNRGNSTFSGESSEYGDFFGLDDLFTEQPAVVDGMIDIYKTWIGKYGVDGFRIDTVKHVNMEFWQKFSPAMLGYAASQNNPNFFMYGEVFDGNPEFMSRYTTEGKLPATLDFGFQGQTRGFASQSSKTDNLRDFFSKDDYYTDADSNAYELPTFLGNHDIGRLGFFMKQDNPSAADAELLARDELAHGLMFFARGMPVIYYGDEQGFVGDGGDKDARQDMFGSQVASYNDDDLIGTDATTATPRFDQTHPLYKTFQEYAKIRAANKALQFGAQIHRYSSSGAGIYAFSRIDRDEKIEYVLAFNNSTTAQTATFPTYTAGGVFAPLLGSNTPVTASAAGQVTVTVPPLSFAIYKADRAIGASTAAPGITINTPAVNATVNGRVEVGATLDHDQFAEVTFAVKANDGEWQVIGTDNNAPYRVFYDTTKLPAGTQLTFKAIVNDLNGHLASTTTTAQVGSPNQGCNANPQYAVIHYQRPDGNYDGWGLHLWGDAIDPAEATTWDKPKPINGEDEYGVFWFVKLQDAKQPLNFIIHKGDQKDPGPDQSFVPADTPQVWIKSGDETIYLAATAAQGYVTLHYNRPGGDYQGWGLHLWGDAIDPSEATTWDKPKPPTGTDQYGVYWDIKIQDATQPVNFIVHKGDDKDTPDDRSFDPASSSDVYIKQGDAKVYTSQAAADNKAVIHYHRTNGDYGDYNSANSNDFWGLHVWTGAATPTEWTQPLKPARQDRFGVVFEVPLQAGATTLNYIIHKGDEKDQPEDQALDLQTYGNEVWIVQGTPPYLLPIVNTCDAGDRPGGDLKQAAAHWVDQNTILWKTTYDPQRTYRLHYAPTGGITLNNGTLSGGQALTLTYDPHGISDAVREKFPHLASYSAFKINGVTREQIAAILKGQLAVSATGATGVVVDATGVQIPGVLDDLYTYIGPLGVVYGTDRFDLSVRLNLWAPTAKSVKLHVFDTSTAATGTVYPMTWNAATGVWSVQGNVTWTNKFYLYEVEVYVHNTDQVERNLVTDPYSFSLSTNSARSQIVNLNDPRLKPGGWDTLQKPAPVAPSDISIYELHVRDFSVYDQLVPQQYRGTYKAFTQQNSNGMQHLRQLAQAGLTHVHLLPVFDIATIEEDRSKQQQPNQQILESGGPASEQQQAEIGRVRAQDAYNWGYDPLHYTTPEGSYATNPDGVTRILEFREMVQALNKTGLRVVMDVVYNHTSASGQDPKSILDRVVPGYYQRLNPETGAVETSTCCQNTATEHNMMEKLMIDSVTTWATAYKVDGFRFDLMGHHMKRNMVKLRDTLNALTPANSGVNGKQIYVYGEGWNFGEVANNARGVNATQQNMAGTGIGTFNDRLRDAVRGGSPFDSGQALIQNQGFINGLYSDPNALNQGDDDERQRLLYYGDLIKVGLTGNLRDYSFVDRTGKQVTGAQVDYNGSPAGYTLAPQEAITYIEAHDNQTLYDNNVYKAPRDTAMADRVRMQNLGTDIVSLGQGVAFFQAGQDMLRSKSLDRDSYDSGDWFNRLDWTYTTNNFGVGLPPAWTNQENWPIMRPLLADPTLKPQRANILRSVEHMREMLQIRNSSPLFHLPTAADVQQRLSFLNTGPNQVPGMIVMRLDDTVGQNLDKRFAQIVVLFNATDEAQTFSADAFKGVPMNLHPVLAQSSDPLVRTSSYNQATGTFNVPARTTAVFVVDEQGAPVPRGPNTIFVPEMIQNKEPGD